MHLPPDPYDRLVFLEQRIKHRAYWCKKMREEYDRYLVIHSRLSHERLKKKLVCLLGELAQDIAEHISLSRQLEPTTAQALDTLGIYYAEYNGQYYITE